MNNLPATIPDYVNVSKMAQLLNLSRSRLYQLIDKGILLQPVYLISTKHPVYSKEMALRNLNVKNSNVGVNGEIVMFYSVRTTTIISTKKTTKKPPKQTTASSKHSDLIDALESLGLENITTAQIESAIQICFPDGIENISEDEILREVFRYLKCQNNEHKP
jgi:hypothetical protein